MNKPSSLLLSATALLLVMEGRPLTAFAQEVTTAGENNAGLEEVVVTARRRAEPLIETPVSVTAITAEQIEQKGLVTLDDIANFTPGLTINHGTDFANDRSQITIITRGMVPQAGGAASTSVFINGAPMSSGRISSIEDLDQVEVIRGPQSAYFGRTTFAGAINLVPRDPSDEFQGRLSGTFGSYSLVDLRATLEGPIVQDKLLARLSIRGYEQNGEYPDQYNPGREYGDQSTKEGNIDIVARPTDDLRVKLFSFYADDNDGPAINAKFGPAYFNCNPGAGPYICGAAPSIGPGTIGENTSLTPLLKAELLHNSTGVLTPVFSDNLGLNHGGSVTHTFHGSVVIDYDIESIGATLSLLSAGNVNHNAGLFDFTNQYLPDNERFLGLRNQLFDDTSQEVRLTSDQSGSFRWTIGGSYGWTRRQYEVGFSSPYGILNGVDGSPQETTTYAVFFGAAYDFTDYLTLNFEGRYQLDQVKLLNLSPETVFVGADYRNFLPRVILQYKFMPDMQVYASYAQGANPGQFNSQFITSPPAEIAYVEKNYNAHLVVNPEILDSYELGIKGRLWDGKAQFSADVYHAIWSNQIIQESVPVPLYNAQGQPTAGTDLFTVYANVGKTVLDGVEVEGAVAPTSSWTISASGSVNASDIREYYCETCVSLTGNPNVKGNQLPNYSKYHANVSVDYHIPIEWNDLVYYVHGDYIFESSQYDSEANLVTSGDRNLINLRTGFRRQGSYIEGFVTNLTNNKAYTSINSYPDLAPGGTNALLAGLPPLRQWGVRLTYQFGGLSTPETPAAAYVPPPVEAPKPAPSMARSYMVFFDFNKSDLTPQAVAIVDQAARNAGPAKVTQLTVTGHTDTVGSDAYNMRLSRRRAESVAAELEKQGIPSSEIEIVAKGKKDLLVPTADGVREPQNRRVQIVYSAGLTS